jgi:hypothetical protein
MPSLIDRKFRVPRIWSNQELRRFAGQFHGSVANVSAWRDEDKEGARYRDYFKNASEYCITNYKSEARGFQGGMDNEIYLDLTRELRLNCMEGLMWSLTIPSWSTYLKFRSHLQTCVGSRETLPLL